MLDSRTNRLINPLSTQRKLLVHEKNALISFTLLKVWLLQCVELKQPDKEQIELHEAVKPEKIKLTLL